MFNEKTSEEDISTFLSILSDKGDLESFMSSCYSELTCLGAASKSIGGLLLDAALLNTRVCIAYFMSIEDYKKVAAMRKLYSQLSSPPNTVEIDVSIIRSIVFYHN